MTSKNVDDVLRDETLYNGIIKLFNPKDFLNRNLFELESHLEAAKKSSANLAKSANALEAKL